MLPTFSDFLNEGFDVEKVMPSFLTPEEIVGTGFLPSLAKPVESYCSCNALFAASSAGVRRRFSGLADGSTAGVGVVVVKGAMGF